MFQIRIGLINVVVFEKHGRREMNNIVRVKDRGGKTLATALLVETDSPDTVKITRVVRCRGVFPIPCTQSVTVVSLREGKLVNLATGPYGSFF